MLREPQKSNKSFPQFAIKTRGRFQVVKLEERIAPKTCQYDGTDSGQSCSKHGPNSRRP